MGFEEDTRHGEAGMRPGQHPSAGVRLPEHDPGTSTMLPAAPTGPDLRWLSPRRIPQLQRAAGNRATGELILQRESENPSTDAGGTAVQRARRQPGSTKGQPLPGRRKRRRADQEEELAGMDRANTAWEKGRTETKEDAAHNPFGLLADLDEAEQTEPEAVVPKGPDLAMLEQANSDVAAIRAVLAGHYDTELAAQMSRTWRGARIQTGRRGFADIAALVVAAGGKLTQQHEKQEKEAPDTSPARLNARGGHGPKRVKRGAGWLAGEGKSWHVHYDHVKYGGIGSSRINFPGRQKADVLADLTLTSAAISDKTNLQACRIWINANL